MSFIYRTAKLRRHGPALVVAALLQAILLDGLSKGFAMHGPPDLGPYQKWQSINLVFTPRFLPCCDCRPPSREPPCPRPKPIPRYYDAKPLNSPSTWISIADYPAEDLKNGYHGVVRFALNVDKNGKAIKCEILSSSGISSLDEVTCRQMLLRARFKSAVDETGKLVPSRFRSAVRWSMPD